MCTSHPNDEVCASHHILVCTSDSRLIWCELHTFWFTVYNLYFFITGHVTRLLPEYGLIKLCQFLYIISLQLNFSCTHHVISILHVMSHLLFCSMLVLFSIVQDWVYVVTHFELILMAMPIQTNSGKHASQMTVLLWVSINIVTWDWTNYNWRAKSLFSIWHGH